MPASICLTYDDALPVHRELVAPSLAERGLRGTFYAPAARDELHEHAAGWRELAAAGHELGNHACWHPCLGRPAWLPSTYHLENYDRQRMRDELVMASRVLRLLDGRSERSFAACCGDTSVGTDGESFLADAQELFSVMRNGSTDLPGRGPMPFAVPALLGDGRRASDLIAVAERLPEHDDSWLVVLMHGVGAGTHNSFIDANQHALFLDWIAEQRDWLRGVTLLDAARNSRPSAKA